MHQQICQTKDGRLVYKDLKLYMSYGQQCARTYREKPVQHFVKEGRWWRQFK